MELVMGGYRRNMLALGFFVFFLIVSGTLLSYFQERLIYFPGSQDFSACAPFRNAEKRVQDGTRFYFKNNGPRLAIIYHGNAGSACDRDFLAYLVGLSGYSYIVPEYTGYSNDSRKPSHEAIKRDVRHIIDFLQEYGDKEVAIIGESIGTGVAAYHASLLSPDKIILLSPFTNLVEVARHHYWYYPVRLLVDNAFDNTANLAQYRGHILILQGEEDDIILPRLGEELFTSLKTTQKEFRRIPDAGHNTLFDYTQTHDAIVNFLKK